MPKLCPDKSAHRFAKERRATLAATRTCPVCFQPIAASDRVAQDGDRPVLAECLERRAQAARDRATELVKTSEQLLAHADVLAREADVAIAEARPLVRDGIAARVAMRCMRSGDSRLDAVCFEA